MLKAPVVHAAPCPSAAVAAHMPAATRGIRVDLDGDGTADRAAAASVCPRRVADHGLRPVLSYWNGGFASHGSTGWGCGGAGEVVRRWVGSNGYEEDRYALRGTRYLRIARRGDSHLRRSPSWLGAVVGPRSIGFGNCAVKYA